MTVTPESTIAGLISGNQSLTGSLSPSDFENATRSNSYRDDYRLTGVAAGQQIQVNLDSTAPYFDTYLQLVNEATGEVVGFNDDANGTTDSQLAFTVQAGATYLLRVTSYSPRELGSYTLTTTTLATASLAVGQSVAGTLSNTDPDNPLQPGAYRDDYQLTGVVAGQQIRINLSSEAFDTYVSLLGDGAELASNDDVSPGDPNSELVFTAQAGVNYIIRASSYRDGSLGTYTLSTTLLSGPDWISANITDPGLQTIVRSRFADNILDRNDILAILRDPGLTDGDTIDATEVANLRTLASNAARFRMPDYVQFLFQQVVNGAFTNINVALFDANFVQRWFLGTGPLGTPTPQFDTRGANNRLVTTFLSFTPAQGNLYSAAGRARIEDIDQGSFGDCAFLAALAATFARNDDPSNSGGLNNAATAVSSLLDRSIIANGDDTYTFRFFDNSTPQWVTVDQRVVTLNGRIFGANANESSNPNDPSNVLWVPLAERAYAQWREGREGSPGYDLIGNGDTLENPLSYVTGRAATSYRSTATLDTFNTINTALQQGRAITAGGAQLNSPFLISSHAYSVNNAYVDSNNVLRVVVRNPWGEDVGSWPRSPVDDRTDGFLDLPLTFFAGDSPNTGFGYFSIT